jgi:uncharacterized protein GlcG (DUF336 family)
MDEAVIRKTVESLVGKMLENNTKEHEHVCKCVKNIPLSTAKKLIDEIEKKAEQIGVKAVIAVGNSSGNIIAVHSMDDAYIASYDIAVNKVFTSVALKMPTKQLAELAAPNGSLYGIQFTNNGKIIIFGGGEPLESNGKIIGGLGVSGGNAQQDTMLGEFGRDKFLELIK